MTWPTCDSAGLPKVVRYPERHVEMRDCAVFHRLVTRDECDECPRAGKRGETHGLPDSREVK